MNRCKPATIILWSALFSCLSLSAARQPMILETAVLAQARQEPIRPVIAPAVTPIRPPAGAPTDGQTPALQGFSPFAIALTKDGTYAYIGFDLSEVAFKVRLSDLHVEGVADLSAYFPLESELIALDASERKLFVHSATRHKLLVLDTQTMSVVHAIDNINATGLFRSEHARRLIVWDGSNTVRFVDTDTYAVTTLVDDRTGFVKIQESATDPRRWFVTTQQGPGGPLVVGVYDREARTWLSRILLPMQASGEGVFDLKVLPNERKAYLATLGGWYPDYHAYGWLRSIDLVSGQVKALAIDGGALCLEASPDSTRLYVGTGWPQPAENNLLAVDTQADAVLGPVTLGKSRFGWNYKQMNDLVISPNAPLVLYATSGDGNALVKVRLDDRTLDAVLVMNEESLKTRFLARRPKDDSGVVLAKSNSVLELDLGRASVRRALSLPPLRPDGYDAAFTKHDRLLVAQGESVLEVDGTDLRLLATRRLATGLPALWSFVVSKDQQRIYSVSQGRGTSGYSPDMFLAINTSTYQVEARLKLEGGAFTERPYELPDSSKIYALGGQQNGPVVVHVVRTGNWTIDKTITFNEPGYLGISAGPFYPYAYDSASHTLFVGATYVVLAIDTSTDQIKQVIRLADAPTALGFEPRQFTYLNAVGLVYHPRQNRLYIAHLDRNFISVYDLTARRFLPRAIALKGYFPHYLFANDAYSKIYSLNGRSDNVSVIDVESLSVESVIDLHAYLQPK